MKPLFVVLFIAGVVLAACNTNNGLLGSVAAVASPTPTPNPALGAPIGITMVPLNYSTPSPNPSASASPVPTPGSQQTYTFGTLATPPQTALLTATEINYGGSINMSLSSCASPAPITLVIFPGNPQQASPVNYTVSAVNHGSCTVNFADGLGHSASIVVSVP